MYSCIVSSGESSIHGRRTEAVGKSVNVNGFEASLESRALYVGIGGENTRLRLWTR
jgi:hypothetical protein